MAILKDVIAKSYLSTSAPVAVAPATITKKIVTPKCVLAFEEIETQNCVPKVATILLLDTVQFTVITHKNQ